MRNVDYFFRLMMLFHFRKNGSRVWACMVIIISHFSFLIPYSFAQVGEYRNDLAIGGSVGYSMSSIAFVPIVPQSQLGGLTFGLTARYTCEKYFSSICAVVGEVNYAQIGWKERIWDKNDQPVVMAADTTQALSYSRKMSYVQVPFLARLGWGRERSGLQFFFQVGPQIGFFLSEKTETNFDRFTETKNQRSSYVVAQDTMAVENKFDYGIVAGAGIEFSNRHLGHFILEGRYYYGLGNIYGATKRDYFARSNFGNIVVKCTYLFDIVRTKNSKIK